MTSVHATPHTRRRSELLAESISEMFTPAGTGNHGEAKGEGAHAASPGAAAKEDHPHPRRGSSGHATRRRSDLFVEGVTEVVDAVTGLFKRKSSHDVVKDAQEPNAAEQKA
jgi:hypothetical protein